MYTVSQAFNYSLILLTDNKTLLYRQPQKKSNPVTLNKLYDSHGNKVSKSIKTLINITSKAFSFAKEP